MRTAAVSLLPERSRRDAVLALALPIIGGMVSQNVLNLVDTFMVSRLGAAQVAAVGLGGFANFMATAFITGLSAGVQASAARRRGEGRTTEMAIPLNGGLIMVAAIAIPASVALFLLTPRLFPLLADDAAVRSAGIPYLQVRLIGMLAIGCNFAFRGYWNGVSLSRLYLRTLVVMHVCNIALSYVLIFGHLGMPALGTTGAGIGTMLSTYLGTGYYFWLGRRHARDAGFLRGVPSLATLKAILRVSLPSGVQQFFLACGLTALFVIIGSIGTAELAAGNIITNVSLFAYLPGLGLGLAAASLVGQALGRGDVADAERWGWDVVRLGSLAMFALALPLMLVPELIVGVFFPHGGEAAQVAIVPLRIAGAVMPIEAVSIILLNASTGAGATRLSMGLSIAMQSVFLPLAYLLAVPLELGLTEVWIANAACRAGMALVLAVVWRRRAWVGVQV